jgi:hypothetical protein
MAPQVLLALVDNWLFTRSGDTSETENNVTLDELPSRHMSASTAMLLQQRIDTISALANQSAARTTQADTVQPTRARLGRRIFTWTICQDQGMRPNTSFRQFSMGCV